MSGTFDSPRWLSPWGFARTPFRHGKDASLLGDFEEGPGVRANRALLHIQQLERKNREKEGVMWLEVREDSTSLSGDCRVWGVACMLAMYQKGCQLRSPSALGLNPLLTGCVNFDRLL